VTCEQIEKYGQHNLMVVYSRPWWRLFRYTQIVVCIGCDMRLVDLTPGQPRRARQERRIRQKRHAQVC
jgi:hypothetical protein